MNVAKSIVVPCYNEAANLPALIGRFHELRDEGSDWELLLVDNGSNDDSAAVLEAEISRPGREFVRVVTVPVPNLGYGHGIMTGLRAAAGDYLAWTHADGQTPPSDVLRAFDLLLAAEDPRRAFVKGRRRGRPMKDRLFTFGMQVAAGLLLRENLADINAQPKAFPRDLVVAATDPPDDLSLDLYFFWLARRGGFEVGTFDVSFLDREHGESKWAFSWSSRWRNIKRTLAFMRKIARTKPPPPG